MIFYLLITLFFLGDSRADEIIRDKDGNYYLLKDDGSFKMDMSYFDYNVGLRMTNKKFNDLFGGPAREPESELTQKEMDLARSVQEVTEEIVLKMAKHDQHPLKCIMEPE